jgi:hypothetical protein
MRKKSRMPRVTLPSGNTVDLKSPDDFMAADLFAMHRAVRIKQGPGGETEFSGQELADDRVNAFLAAAITAWSFPSPIPAQMNVAAADVVIGRTMKAMDWAVLRRAALPLMDELEGEGLPDSKSGSGPVEAAVPVPGEPAG